MIKKLREKMNKPLGLDWSNGFSWGFATGILTTAFFAWYLLVALPWFFEHTT